MGDVVLVPHGSGVKSKGQSLFARSHTELNEDVVSQLNVVSAVCHRTHNCADQSVLFWSFQSNTGSK